MLNLKCENWKQLYAIEEDTKPTEFIKSWPFSPTSCENTMESLRNKAMYIEGQERYLKDLDWVNIVKTIRELKALTRILLDQQQRQILAFERESVIPSSKAFEQTEANFLQNKVPFEYSDRLKIEEYQEEVEKVFDNLKHKTLTHLDYNIINELVDEKLQGNREIDKSNQGVMVTNISADLNLNKWE